MTDLDQLEMPVTVEVNTAEFENAIADARDAIERLEVARDDFDAAIERLDDATVDVTVESDCTVDD